MSESLEADHVADVDVLPARLDNGWQAPARLAVDATTPVAPTAGRGDIADAAQELTASALRTLQRLPGEPRLNGAELVWITRSAAGADNDVRDPLRAPLRGLVRAARGEYAERVIRLVDLGDGIADEALLPRAAALTGEPEIDLPPEDAGAGSGVVNTATQFGSATGTAAVGAVLLGLVGAGARARPPRPTSPLRSASPRGATSPPSC
ncbi:hypothetical protein OG410_42300 [Streptomyces sp. NBC_00659]|uniref:hypothetical protein n=1 Tax=Streptomyces sp. NBC_00659 TaxID=2903669 RepID=UPI002E3357ED|nr:hypothetical protein [Streptomyces sp. NBC_00659]